MAKRKITDYRPNPENHNKSSERGSGMIEYSFRELGAGRSIVVDRNNVIIAGNQSQEGALNAGIEDAVEIETDGKTLVVVKRTDLDINDTTGKARKLAYADNRTHEVSFTLDIPQMQLDIESGLDLSGLYTDSELNALAGIANDPTDAPDAQIDRADELREKWQTERGQLWLIPSQTGNGVHRLLCGDSTNADDVERLMAGDKPALLVTDPPYGVDIVGKNNTAGNFPGTNAPRLHTTPIIGDNKPFDPIHLLDMAEKIIIWGGNHFANKLPQSSKWLVWDKKEGAFNGSDLGDCELAWTNLTGIASRLLHHTWQGMYRKGEGEREQRYHPTQKAINVIKWCIEQANLQINETVADVYIGSGTTMVACEQLQRVCYGMEIEPKYTAVILERLAAMGCEPYKDDES